LLTAGKPQSKIMRHCHGQWLIVGDEDVLKLFKKKRWLWFGQSILRVNQGMAYFAEQGRCISAKEMRTQIVLSLENVL